MEPNIYKPNIYKTPTVYKTGANGGGGFDDNSVLLGGKWYRACKINNQIWLAQNLDYIFTGVIFSTSHPMSGSPYCTYLNGGNTEPNKNFGLLYNNYAVSYLQTNRETLIPGWHIPTREEYNSLSAYIEASVGKKLKSKEIWNPAGLDEYGFSALPTAACTNNGYESGWCGLWTSDIIGTQAYYKYMMAGNDDLRQNAYNRQNYLGVRLVHD